MNKLPRKLKKSLIKVFGRGTYQGILEGILNIEKYHKHMGCFVKYSDIGKLSVGKGSRFFHSNQYNPHITFKKIKYEKI